MASVTSPSCLGPNYELFSRISDDDLTDTDNSTVTKDVANKVDHDDPEGTSMSIDY